MEKPAQQNNYSPKFWDAYKEYLDDAAGASEFERAQILARMKAASENSEDKRALDALLGPKENGTTDSVAA